MTKRITVLHIAPIVKKRGRYGIIVRRIGHNRILHDIANLTEAEQVVQANSFRKRGYDVASYHMDCVVYDPSTRTETHHQGHTMGRVVEV